MCGIIGVIARKDEVFTDAFLGLMALQHRGQDSAGIAICKEDKLNIKKKKGLVHEAFSPEDAHALKGNIAIAHTRYATQGKGGITDAQPLVYEGKEKIVFAQNGNMINFFDKRKELKEAGIKLNTTVDTETMMIIFAEEYEKTKDVFKAAKRLLDNVHGGYAVVGMIPGKGIFAIRDPNGIRPLVLGKKDDSFMFSSESVAFQTIDYEFMEDIKPGQAVFISLDMKVEKRIIKGGKCRHCMFEWIYFASPNSMIEGRSVYKTRLALGKQLARTVDKDQTDLVIPVPDSGRTAAIKLAEYAEVRYREGLIKNRYIPRTFIMSTQKKREEAVVRKLMPIISVLKGKNVAIVDDSIVRGTTSKRIVEALKSGGVKDINFISTCPPIKYPCFYGVDMATTGELIAHDKSIEEIRQVIGAEKLSYGTTDDIENAVRRDICMACLNGDYPIELTSQQKKALGTQRSSQHDREDKNG